MMLQVPEVDSPSTDTYTLTLRYHDGWPHGQDVAQMLQDNDFVRLDTVLAPTYRLLPSKASMISSAQPEDDAIVMDDVCWFLQSVGFYAQTAPGTDLLRASLSRNDLKNLQHEYFLYSKVPIPRYQQKAKEVRQKMVDQVTSSGMSIEEIPDKQTRIIKVCAM